MQVWESRRCQQEAKRLREYALGGLWSICGHCSRCYNSAKGDECDAEVKRGRERSSNRIAVLYCTLVYLGESTGIMYHVYSWLSDWLQFLEKRCSHAVALTSHSLFTMCCREQQQSRTREMNVFISHPCSRLKRDVHLQSIDMLGGLMVLFLCFK